MHINAFDEESIYCRKLGHHLKFNYCRQESVELPCSRIIKCWSDKLPVVKAYLENNFSEAELKRIYAPPEPKVISLINLIQKAKAAGKAAK